MFTIEKVLNGRITHPETEFIPVTASTTYKKGALIAITSGKAVLAGSKKATHLCTEDYTAGTSDTHHIQCFILSDDVILRTTLTADTSLVKGGVSAINTTADEATGAALATGKYGVEIVDLIGTKAGSEILCKISDTVGASA